MNLIYCDGHYIPNLFDISNLILSVKDSKGEISRSHNDGKLERILVADFIKELGSDNALEGDYKLKINRQEIKRDKFTVVGTIADNRVILLKGFANRICESREDYEL